MNWLAYNVAHDVALPGAKGPKLGFLMYPQAETAAGAARLPRSRHLQVHDHGARASDLIGARSIGATLERGVRRFVLYQNGADP